MFSIIIKTYRWGRMVDNTLIKILPSSSDPKSPNYRWCMTCVVLYKHNYNYRDNLKKGYLPVVWQHSSEIIKRYKRISRRKKKLIGLSWR